MARAFTAATVSIISIYPLAPEKLERLVGPTQAAGRTIFAMEPVPKGEFRELVVPDMFRLDRDWNVEDRQEGAWKPMLEQCEVLASDLVNAWTNSLIGARESGGKPGIAMFEGEVPSTLVIDRIRGEKYAPFERFLEQLKTSQDAYFQYLYYQGQEMASKQQWNNITVQHRAAALHLGKEEKWVRPESSESQKDCPACFARIDARAWRCTNCREQIAPRPKDFKTYENAAA